MAGVGISMGTHAAARRRHWRQRWQPRGPGYGGSHCGQGPSCSSRSPDHAAAAATLRRLSTGASQRLSRRRCRDRALDPPEVAAVVDERHDRWRTSRVPSKCPHGRSRSPMPRRVRLSRERSRSAGRGGHTVRTRVSVATRVPAGRLVGTGPGACVAFRPTQPPEPRTEAAERRCRAEADRHCDRSDSGSASGDASVVGRDRRAARLRRHTGWTPWDRDPPSRDQRGGALRSATRTRGLGLYTAAARAGPTRCGQRSSTALRIPSTSSPASASSCSRLA